MYLFCYFHLHNYLFLDTRIFYIVDIKGFFGKSIFCRLEKAFGKTLAYIIEIILFNSIRYFLFIVSLIEKKGEKIV